jgi:hypothetical protein
MAYQPSGCLGIYILGWVSYLLKRDRSSCPLKSRTYTAAMSRQSETEQRRRENAS